MKESKIGECDCCGSETDVKEFTIGHLESKRTVFFCDYCSNSYVGNMIEYPKQYDSNVTTLGYSMAMMFNVLEKRIMKKLQELLEKDNILT